MSAVSGQRMAKLTRNVIQSLRNDKLFESFLKVVLIKSKIHWTFAELALPRWKRAPKIYEIEEGKGFFPETAKDYYRRIYFESLDVLIAAIAERFIQIGLWRMDSRSPYY